jgi:predicted SAM-dependent methyltransferase
VIGDAQVKGFPRGIIHADASRGLPYTNGSVSYVYSSHMIEHLSRSRALNFAKECRRVLCPNGVLRLATPDLAKILAAYEASGPSQDGEIARGDVLMTRLGMFHELEAPLAQRMIHRVASASYHQWLYDSESLTRLLAEGGFSDTRVCAYRKGETPDLDQLEHRPESLIIEAYR